MADEPQQLPARNRLHHDIRREFTSMVAAVIRSRPERLDEPGFEADLDTTQRLMLRVLAIVDNYEIRDKPTGGA